MPYIIISLMAIAALVLYLRKNRFVLPYKKSDQKECERLANSLQDKITHCFRSNELHSLQNDVEMWFSDYDTYVEMGWLNKRRRELIDLINFKREKINKTA